MLDLYRQLVRIRSFEEKVQELHKLGKLPGFVHVCIGEEAIAVGTCSVLTTRDHITSTHRGHGHMIAKGADVGRMYAEIFGRVDGYCRGKGGSMHIIDTKLGILGANGIVGGGIPMATGAGLSEVVLGGNGVSVCFFGDGAANQGVLFEALNLASIWKLPVIYICESNNFMEYTPTADLTAGHIYERSIPFGVPGIEVDGNDVLAVRKVVQEAVDRARRGEGPTLIEAVTYRIADHAEGESAFLDAYRPDSDIEQWRDRDPISRFRTRLLSDGIDEGVLDEIVQEERARVEAGVEFAEASPFPSEEETLDHVFAVRGA
ncbi:MAG: thiamine pyrophosphate-dependent dehydrogenase E1 component subunit alpha [Acidimicrobiia bacterium]